MQGVNGPCLPRHNCLHRNACGEMRAERTDSDSNRAADSDTTAHYYHASSAGAAEPLLCRLTTAAASVRALLC